MGRYLDKIDGPADVKKLTVEQLQELAQEIRHELITVLAKNGGHLAPNLGVVELTIALHYVFSTPTDKLVWDVSHQTYVHKLLTGRRRLFHTIRTTGGLSGFASRAESEHDSFGAGHAGTALSAALGMAVARDKRGGTEHIVCIFGDAALTNGITYEALNNIANTTNRFIAILNDNEWSIAKNVGAIALYLNKVITNPRYNRLQKDFKRLLRHLPKGEIALMLARQVEEGFKRAMAGVSLELTRTVAPPEADGRGGYGNSIIFEELGLRYLGPIDGHDLPMLIHFLEFAKNYDRPIVLHVLTQKGKGYHAAQQHPEKFHGLGPYNIATGDPIPPQPGSPPNYSDVFGQALVKLCQQNPALIGITAAMPTGTGLRYLERAMPDRYFDVGIAEEHAVIFAAGMAAMGLRPVVAIYSTFMQRAFDCIVHDVCLQDVPVILCMDRAGLSASDGPTHHGLFDIAFLRAVPNIIGMAPKDEDELVDMLFTATQVPHPVFIRYPRGAAEGVPIKDTPAMIQIGKAELIQDFTNTGAPKVAIFGLGNMNRLARNAAIALAEHGFDCAVINPRFIKPLDAHMHERYGRAADIVVTIEDHVVTGGYGSAVLELFNELGISRPVIRIGWPDKFIEHASTDDELRAKYGLTTDNIVAKVLAAASAAERVTEPSWNQNVAV
ncbi:MAG: 1-deoxy-D-xylulose-5-phosphate synthase [Verrucomicrobiae bacterium]|nr:1-deoxy-D-xylulose-5-phosphate synthase [Verrucomicrobiae bacterium]MDW7979849.1 1-deoxy-D-xylulose-5-phosphate synthase [Verrucomicrobiales bacterium]